MAQPGDRRGVAFAAVVVIIAAVGLYLALWPDSEEPAAEQAPRGVTTSSPVVESTPLATASDAPFDVYAYLPMSKEQLAAAADLAERFTAEYGTFRHDEDPAAYAARVKQYTTAELGDILARTLTSPGTVERNRADEVVSTTTAALKEIRQIDRTSVVFVVTGTQRLATKSGTKQLVEQYAVTVSQLGADWRVFELRPAGEGQDGDPEG
ncbi:hypothetical protein LDL08_31330 [Nonomuraea glycinis]|uniref:Uncharacterized protein n=1 Tax=Nonomuraea glycinis TaxID=2047744 RepID=A0A918A8W7_9ACTN|nr:hypothetical protein [Nonomuraea glycinis]MCA2180680.1 hypothetical protein [Nonomuraea glycinis]GGP11931.1 hypothetical protein GCM10012278_57660 [Nonomuraea glycinis]